MRGGLCDLADRHEDEGILTQQHRPSKEHDDQFLVSVSIGLRSFLILIYSQIYFALPTSLLVKYKTIIILLFLLCDEMLWNYSGL